MLMLRAPKKGQKVRVNSTLGYGKVVSTMGDWALVAFTGPKGPYVVRYNWRSGRVVYWW